MHHTLTHPTPARARRCAPLADPWRLELQTRVARDGLRATARALDVPAETLRRAVRGDVLYPLTARALAGALALTNGGSRVAA